MSNFRTIILTTLIGACSLICRAEPAIGQHAFSPGDRPRLVVGIVVDQMKFEYLPRFWNKFGDDGFKRLVNDGFLFANHHFHYFPTYTGPGHASIYAGATPAVHGIVGNTWYDRAAEDLVYVVADSSVRTVGAKNAAGEMSPRNLLSTTVTDELKKAVPGSTVVAVSIKDRSSVLAGGHLADQAFWYDFDTGHFISSTWYMDELPEWVQDFNDQELARQYSRKVWTPLLPLEEYVESDADNAPYERAFGDEQAPVFPHRMNESLTRIITSPFGDALLGAFVREAIAANHLGEDEITDFLAVSFSAPDYVGHRFGPKSVEVEDVYLQLDRQIAELLSLLDDHVGECGYLLFLTADHGVAEIPRSLVERGLPGGDFDGDAVVDSLTEYLARTYGDGKWVLRYVNQQVYLNRKLIAREGLSFKTFQDDAARFLRRFEGVAATNTAHNYATAGYGHTLEAFYQNGFYYGRSGDVFIQLASGWVDSTHRTSHGSPYNYDTHVPLIFYGWHIQEGTSSRRTLARQIAPTLSSMLHIAPPSGAGNRLLRFEGHARVQRHPSPYPVREAFQ